MAKVYLVSKTKPEISTVLGICKEALGRSVSNLADTKSRPIDLQRYALMLSEALDPDADYSILENLGPVLGQISFTFATLVHDNDFKDVSTYIKCEMLRLDTRMTGVSLILMHANLKFWRELIVDSLSSNITSYTVLNIITSIHDIIKSEGFNRLWNDVDISRSNEGFIIKG